ncbi:MAG: transcriptional regulator [Omnitrophica bacterium RIFCSPLOWO2_12_FULL_44_17]|uniref:Transcriptional regulator n=1 Tax=Candidatus Danuiimicrobium aquiferis TaxID=1801832 RepID=A0A1G1KX29_9BACT|nr:MAG: transcriptional regulator [Omnitrophica bacterium RIFCSPHIGHO2_02_FULL_45_28]OGW89610.1 MAG: transcriptional regulator [Omnitrophica bacterium RIFCSPHIGHO2_12_FULL_44_12]OGW97415.1 MAG: transcriptional regulator [Omnitrophica bacterium RIFCSPLOWO2_12_FULL_44_17]OGX04489.1 MAG: transcriptional regulator [Omnitrophica bacterium RIFCSPLOWO2_02_FULL_44_11]
MHIPLLDLKAQYDSIKQELDQAVHRVIESQKFILGPDVESCETAVAQYCKTRFACGISSGTDALIIALMCENIGTGHEVITSPYTFFATAGSIARVGATPVFVDIDPDTYNLAPDQIQKKITAKTKAIMPVHLYGQVADMDPIVSIAKKHQLTVIEDACQAIGAEYKGKRAGSIGDYGCFSFFPSKNLGCFGDGGIVVTNDEDRAKKLKMLRAHGSSPKYYHPLIGGNFRLDSIQAAVITVKIKYLDGWSNKRQENAQYYERLFIESGMVKKVPLSLPETKTNRHIFNQFIIRVPKRDELITFLKEKTIGCEIYYPLPLHVQECFRYLGYREGDFPESEKAAKETIAIPIYPELEKPQMEYVVNSFKTFYGI